MEPDMSIRNRNALGLFRLISASYDMLPPFAIRRNDIPKGAADRTVTVPCIAGTPAAPADARCRGRYRRACVALEANAQSSTFRDGGSRRRPHAFATRCRAAARPETWRAIDIE